jgi:hypothetical protein
MIGLAFLAACIWWGLSLLRLFRIDLSTMERAVVGPVAGLALGTWLLFQSASIFGRLGVGAFAVVFVILAATSVLARRRPAPTAMPVPRWFIGLAGALLVAFVVLNLFAVLAPSAAGSMAFEHVWADTPFHSGIITSFAYRENYPPAYPQALGQPLNYPFLVDLLSSVLLRYGLTLRMSIVVVNVLLQTAVMLGLALVVHRLTASARAAVLGVVVFFLLGNLGWFAVPGDISDAGGIGTWLRDLPWSYTGETAGVSGRERLGVGIYLGNPVFIHLLPRRATAFGMAVGASLLLLIDDLVERRHVATAALVGLLAGVLPRIHAHSAIALAIVAAVWIGREALALRRESWQALRPLAVVTAVTGVIALVIVTPQVLGLREQTSQFFAFWPGWTGEPREAFMRAAGGTLAKGVQQSIKFWFFNGGLLLLLVPIAWVDATRRIRRWYLPFAVVWLVGFLVRTQPWEWDNNNHFVWWQFATVVLVVPLIDKWLGHRALLARAGAVVALVALTLGGILSFIYAAEHRLGLWGPGDVKFARDVRFATPEDAVILTSGGHTQPVTGLSGRQVVMGYGGWLSTHGIDLPRFEADVNAMLAGDVGRMRRLGVDYVVIGPWEYGQATEKQFTIGSVFDDPDVFKPVLDEMINGQRWRLLELLPPSRARQNAQSPRT